MIKYFWSGWTTRSLKTVCGTLLFLGGVLPGAIASNPTTQTTLQAPLTTEAATTETSSITTPDPAQLLPTETERSLSPAIAPANFPVIATVQSHTVKGKLAVILRVRNIPVLTFLSAPGDLSSTASRLDPTQSPAFLRATTLANRLNQFAQDPNFDSHKIAIVKNKGNQSYSLKIGDEVLASLNKFTVLPETNKYRGVDALQATNRLRRLMGNAASLNAIALPANRSVNASGNLSQADAGQTPDLPLRTSPVKGGMASWYGPGFHGRQTANGERYNQRELTAAHRSLPFNTKVRVTNLRNGQSVIVRINDRGPFARGRVIDLSAGAARSIGVFSSGVAPVQIEVLLP